ncbi:DUF4270 domain-containing protein [Sabulilitoribacter arenilitoris]|uniref:DUF4270 domain-containing protein n=1 Tax=Wocania arenilitoris TaxID=2044858 RepID=A0AAE3EL99_9FLAO|nr:DUF4270 domain-containing protein [Wocania arenilitoris]MCF7566937.1 DUF4270 domain-containing protein [Wocania arenilitoris]
MKKTFKALKFSSIFLLVMALFIACDKDFNSIESDVLGKDNANFNTDSLNLQILAYNKKLNSLQINGLSSNLFGVFNDPAFGQTTASIITQITPNTFSPNFGDNPEIDSVVLSIPYYSKQVGTEEGTTNIKYSIEDSLYGNSPVKLTIYRNNYFLRDFNPSSEFNETQNYFSNASASTNSALDGTNVINFEDHKGEMIYDYYDDNEQKHYLPSGKAIILKSTEGEEEVVDRQVPALRVHLDKDYWKTVIIDKEGDPALSNTNNFRDYFRGLYFKAEPINGAGNMTFFNLSSANITIYYSKDSTVDGQRTQSNYSLNFTGNTLNTFINDYSIALTNGNKTTGDERLYLKGAEGSMAVVDLFGGEMVECEDESGVITMRTPLDCFKKTYRELDENGEYLPKVNGDFPLKRLINEAHLLIYEDENADNGGDPDFHKFDRLYAYDIKNNIPTIDYSLDPTGSQNTNSNPLNSKIFSLGQRITDNNGISKYKIRITEHLNNILLKDSTNTKLGLLLSTNVNLTNNFKILDSGDEVTETPAAAILTPRGTTLYGNHQNVPENRKMKLEIFFTEPNF